MLILRTQFWSLIILLGTTKAYNATRIWGQESVQPKPNQVDTYNNPENRNRYAPNNAPNGDDVPAGQSWRKEQPNNLVANPQQSENESLIANIPSIREDSLTMDYESTVAPPTTTETEIVPLEQPVPVVPASQNTITIAVLGRSGSGISSTVRQLIGPNYNCYPEGNESLQQIGEYTFTGISLADGKNYTVKLLDVPGMNDGRKQDEDSQILSTLKAYIQANQPPDFYITISRFDDNRYDGINSLFVQTLKRIELFHNEFLNKTLARDKSKVIFLLTRLMSGTKSEGRRPDKKMDSFKRVIETFTQFPSPVKVLVGDNNAQDEGTEVVNGYFKLPNKQLYPRNIWETLIELASNETTRNVLSAMMSDREGHTLECKAKLFSAGDVDFFEDTLAFYYLLTKLDDTSVKNTEVNQRIQDQYEQLNETERMKEVVISTALQLQLEQGNLTQVAEFPKSDAGLAAFFQESPLFSAPRSLRMLKTLGLEMPVYISPLTVGYGYVVTEDELSPSSPFITDITEPSPVGFKLPHFMLCNKLFKPETESFISYSTNMTDYIQERLKYIEFDQKQIVNISSFSGVRVKEGFNLKPSDDDNMVSLTAVQEYRTMICKLNLIDLKTWKLNPEFESEIWSLEKFNRHNKSSVNEWKNWFSKWGSHIVTRAYGGGRLHGSIVGPNVRQVLTSISSINETLESILQFTPFPNDADLGNPSYRLFGGESDAASESMYSLSANEREDLLSKWKESLKHNFMTLTNDLRLAPISVLVNFGIGLREGEMVEEAAALLLKGKLEYERKPKSQRRRPSGNTMGRRNETETGQQTVRNPIETVGENAAGTGGAHQPLPLAPSTTDTPTYSASETGHLPDFDHGIPGPELFRNNSHEIAALEHILNSTKVQGEQQHKRRIDEMNRSQQALRQRQNETQMEYRKMDEQNLNASRVLIEAQILRIQQQTESEKRKAQNDLEKLRRKMEEDERRHNRTMTAIKEMREKQEKEDANDCSFFLSWFKCKFRWVKNVF